MDTALRTGQIVPIGQRVFDVACCQVARWRAGGADLNLAVNLSAWNLANLDLADLIASRLETAGLDAANLWLEVTETSLVEDIDEASAVLHKLAATGISVAIDDFGTGWASLTFLKAFPVHAQADRTFVQRVDHGTSDMIIARSIVALGVELGFTVIAEGIESQAQLDALVALGARSARATSWASGAPADALSFCSGLHADSSRTGR